MRNVVLRAWDGVNFGLYRQTSPALDAPLDFGRAGAPFTAQQFVRAIGPARDFYTKVLGWAPWFDGVTNMTCNNFGMPANFVGMPKKVAILHAAPDVHGQVELVQWDGFTGRDLADRAVAPNLGILALRIPVSNVAERAAALRAAGANIAIAPTTLALDPDGEVMLVGLRAPDGTLIEMFGPP
jgi:catechol 2,3-dioxygenase-like lactoylglutathione lyase family enzyme